MTLSIFFAFSSAIFLCLPVCRIIVSPRIEARVDEGYHCWVRIVLCIVGNVEVVIVSVSVEGIDYCVFKPRQGNTVTCSFTFSLFTYP